MYGTRAHAGNYTTLSTYSLDGGTQASYTDTYDNNDSARYQVLFYESNALSNPDHVLTIVNEGDWYILDYIRVDGIDATAPTATSPTKAGLGTPALAGIAVASFLALIAVLVILYLCRRRRQSHGEIDNMGIPGVTPFGMFPSPASNHLSQRVLKCLLVDRRAHLLRPALRQWTRLLPHTLPCRPQGLLSPAEGLSETQPSDAPFW